MHMIGHDHKLSQRVPFTIEMPERIFYSIGNLGPLQPALAISRIQPRIETITNRL